MLSSAIYLGELPPSPNFPAPNAERPSPRRARYFHQGVSAGFPSPAVDYVERTLDLNELLAAYKASTFFFRILGDSMKDAGILHEDIVAVTRAVEARHEHIVIAMLNNEFTIKRLYQRRGAVELRPENAAYKPIRLTEEDELLVWGVTFGVIRLLPV